jgi:hypothetical protein
MDDDSSDSGGGSPSGKLVQAGFDSLKYYFKFEF